MKSLGIVVLNYNTWAQSNRLLKQLAEFDYSMKIKIYFVDNDSKKEMPESTSEILEKYSDRIFFSQSEYNGGYNYGNNIGLKNAINDNCSYFLIMNNDIQISQETISEMIDFLDETQGAGIVGPQIVDINGEHQDVTMMCSTTISGKYAYLMRKTPLKFLFARTNARFSQNSSNVKQTTMVNAVSGACFMVTKACMDYIYPLDEGPFLYEEEIIIGSKLENSNFKTYYLPEVEVIHDHGASTGGMTGFAFMEFTRSEQYFLMNYRKANLIQRAPLLLIRFSQFCVNRRRNPTFKEISIYQFIKRTYH